MWSDVGKIRETNMQLILNSMKKVNSNCRNI